MEFLHFLQPKHYHTELFELNQRQIWKFQLEEVKFTIPSMILFVTERVWEK